MGDYLVNKMDLQMPIQPEFELKTQYYFEYYDQSRKILFYQFKTKDSFGHSGVKAVPDGCIDIIFWSNKDTFHAEICGSVLEANFITLLSNTEYFGLRFLPTKDLNQVNYSTKEFVGKRILLIDAIPSVYSLIEEIISESEFSKRIILFKNLLYPQIFSISDKPLIIKYVLGQIYKSKGNIKLKDLAEDTGYSTRYLRKQFDTHVGMSPKLFCRITRFQSSLYMLHNYKECKKLDVILDHGYFDQAHLINDFKSFGYVSPNQYLEQLYTK